MIKLMGYQNRRNKMDVEKYLQEAEENLNLAHSSQTKILSQEAAGEDLDIGCR